MCRAIVLAAGQGMRLRPLTDDRPKCLVEYQGKTILDHQIEVFRKQGISDVTVVRGYMRDAFHRSDLHYVDNERPSTTNMVYSLFCAEECLEGDVIVSYGDIVYRPEVLAALQKSPHEFSVAIDSRWRELWERRMTNILEDVESLKIDAMGRITEIGKKSNSLEAIQGQYIGLFKISKGAIEKVKDFYHTLPKNGTFDGKDFENMYMTSFIQEVIDKLLPVHAVVIDGGWVEIDSLSDLDVRMVGV